MQRNPKTRNSASAHKRRHQRIVSSIKLTTTARRVLEAVDKLPKGCGANLIAEAAGISCGKTTPIRGGQYAGKLGRAGWLHREDEWYVGSRGHEIWMGVRYTITAKGKAAIAATNQARRLPPTAAVERKGNIEIEENG